MSLLLAIQVGGGPATSTGSSLVTLAEAIGSGAGNTLVAGNSSTQFALTQVASAVVVVAGGSATQVANTTQIALGSALSGISGTSATQLTGATSAGTGNTPVVGNSSTQFALTQVSSAVVVVSGGSATQVANTTQIALGSALPGISGTSATMLSDVTNSGTGAVFVDGLGAGLQGNTSQGTGTAGVTGIASTTTQAGIAVGLGAVQVMGIGAELVQISAASQGNVVVLGTGTAILPDVTQQSQATSGIVIIGTSACVLQDVAGNGLGTVTDTVQVLPDNNGRPTSNGGARSSGPDAQLTLAEYLRRFGAAQTPVQTSAPPPNFPALAQTARLTALRRRQRMEEEILTLCDFEM